MTLDGTGHPLWFFADERAGFRWYREERFQPILRLVMLAMLPRCVGVVSSERKDGKPSD